MRLKINYKKEFKKNKVKIIYFLFAQIIALLISTTYLLQSSNEYKEAVFFSIILFILIISFFLLKKNIVLFEPIILFSAYYITICLVIWYSVNTNFNSNIFVNNTSFNQSFNSLFSYSAFLYLIGFIFTLLGYYSIKKLTNKIEIEFENDNQISSVVLNIMVFAFLLIGLANFLFNIWYYASGNLYLYMMNVSVRRYEFADGGTTLGYLFAYNGMYIWFFQLLRKGKKQDKIFLIFLIITIIMRLSTGRIFQSLVYLSSFIGIYYFVEISRNEKISNRKYLLMAIGVLSFGVIFYFYRIISSMNYSNMLDKSMTQTFNILIKNMSFYAFDKGNTPNVALLPKIIDSWQSEIGFLYGRSLFSWLINFLPGNIRPGISMPPSVIIKQTWFSHIQSGNLPPTGIGEMYANFGFLGPIIGMYFFGLISKLLYNFTIKKKNYWILVIYINITLGFIALYPKGEFDNLSLWSIVPIMMIYVVSRCITGSVKNLRK